MAANVCCFSDWLKSTMTAVPRSHYWSRISRSLSDSGLFSSADLCSHVPKAREVDTTQTEEE